MLPKLTRASSCPNLTGNVSGDILFDVKSVTNVSTASALDRTQFTKSEVGELIGKGSTAAVHHLKNYSQHVIKKLWCDTPNPSFVEELREQCKTWNIIHGDKTATTPTLDGQVVLVMPKITGIELFKLNWRTAPSDLDDLVTDCLTNAWSKGVIPDDPNLENMIYDKAANKVALVDITPAENPTEAMFHATLDHVLDQVYAIMS